MATLTTVYGANATLQQNQEPVEKVIAGNDYGRVRVLYDSYTVGADDEFGTSGLINMMKIPKGATLLYGRVSMPASGANGQFEVGWAAGANGDESADPNGIFATQDPGDAAVDAEMPSTRPGYMKTFSEEVQVQVDFTEATADSGGDTIELLLFIAVD